MEAGVTLHARADIGLRVWGPFACFSRPEFKVERVSYPMITPSAARGILEAVFWKPEFFYRIREIGVIKLGGQITILRNELSDRQGDEPIWIEERRQQRSSLILKDVDYLIKAEMVLRRHASDPIYKYRDQFRRAAKRGQCRHTPYLGTREFTAFFALPDGTEKVQSLDLDLGPMLLDLAYVEHDTRHELQFIKHGVDGSRVVSGYAQPIFFNARLEGGWLRIPAEKYAEIDALEGEEVYA